MYISTKTKAILTLATITILSGCGGGNVSSTEKSINQETSELTLNPIPERTSTSLALKLKSVEDINTQENSTIIKWELTKHATGQIEYGFDNSYGEYSVKEESFQYDTHTIPLKNLEASTTYNYRVISEDSDGNKVVSQNKTFHTKGTSITVKPTPIVKPILTATGSAKTNWGFQPFSIPNDSVTVQAGGNIQDAINSLPNGGTVKLVAGTFYANRIHLKSNMVLEGAGRGQTTIKFTGVTNAYLMNVTGNATKNTIIRNLTVDATGNGKANGVEITYGAKNVLIENIEIFGAGKSNLLVWNPDWSQGSEHITFKDIISHDTKNWHALSMRFVKGAIIENCKIYNAEGNGIDFSRVLYGEIAYTSIDNAVQGAKFPGSNYIYMHDTKISNSHDSNILNMGGVGIKFNLLGNAGTGKQHMHLKNISVNNSTSGVVDWGNGTPTFAELIIENFTMIGNTSNAIRIKGAEKVYRYGNSVDITAITGTVNIIDNHKSSPASDGVGYTTWGNPK